MRVVLISEVPPAVEGLTTLLVAEGHEPVALLTVRHDGERELDVNAVVRAAPPDLDVVVPGTRGAVAPLLQRYAPDLALCIGFPWKIPPDALAVPRHGIVNGHPALLPRYRGPSPVSWAIRRGEHEIGFTFHYMDAELDTGNILAQERIPLADERTWDELTTKFATAVGNILPRALERVADGDPGDPQDEDAASYFGSFEAEYAWIDWSRSVDEIERQVRAWGFYATPDRGALTEIDGKPVRVLRTSREPGRGRAMECADGTLWIVETETP